MIDWGKFNILDEEFYKDRMPDISKYESPITVNYIDGIIKQIQENNELQIMQQIKTVVDIDKEELIKALNYDRGQYNKGYADGYARGLEEGKVTAMLTLAESIQKQYGGTDNEAD